MDDLVNMNRVQDPVTEASRVVKTGAEEYEALDVEKKTAIFVVFTC